MDCYLNNYSAACNYFYYLVKGKCDPITGSCLLNTENDQLLDDDYNNNNLPLEMNKNNENELNESN